MTNRNGMIAKVTTYGGKLTELHVPDKDGKMGNVVVANGDPLDVKTDVKHVFIQGQEIPLVSKQTELRDQYWK